MATHKSLTADSASIEEEDNSMAEAAGEEDASAAAEAPPTPRSSRKGRMNEYEIALLWNQLRDNIPTGKANRVQLAQMLKQVLLSLLPFNFSARREASGFGPVMARGGLSNR